jgi:hypothetical protein
MSSDKDGHEEGDQEEKNAAENEDIDNILAKEIQSWNDFEYALKRPNAVLFNKMLTECLEMNSMLLYH